MSRSMMFYLAAAFNTCRIDARVSRRALAPLPAFRPRDRFGFIAG